MNQACTSHERWQIAYKILVGKLEGKDHMEETKPTNQIQGWEDPRDGLDVLPKKKIPTSARE
jgi:hypothetical protein